MAVQGEQLYPLAHDLHRAMPYFAAVLHESDAFAVKATLVDDPRTLR